MDSRLSDNVGSKKHKSTKYVGFAFLDGASNHQKLIAHSFCEHIKNVKKYHLKIIKFLLVLSKNFISKKNLLFFSMKENFLTSI